MNPKKSIKLRKSSRTYLPLNIKLPEKEELLEFLKIQNKGLFQESMEFQLIERKPEDYRKMKNDYGLIVNHRNYLLGKTINSADARMSYGFLMEKIVLKATDLNLDTCWMGYFDPHFFPEIDLPKDYIIPSIVIVGYATDHQPIKEKIIRYAVRASRRKSWADLFFNGDMAHPLTPDEAGIYAGVLEMSRLAPSSGNSQPWRIIREKGKNIFHFYKKIVNQQYEYRGLHDVDLGICLAHFELVAVYEGLNGRLIRFDHLASGFSAGLEYKISWAGGD